MARKLPAKASVRRKVYDLIRGIIERDMTIPEQESVRNAVNEYVNAVLDQKEVQLTPMTHTLICRDCAKKRVVTGHKEFTNAYKGKRRGFVAL